jgi:GT2 family glycosyltransferase
VRVAACIAGLRDCDDITACLAALRKSTHFDFEVIICENGGPDANGRLTKALPKRLPGGQEVKLIQALANGSDQRIQALGARWRSWLARAQAICRGPLSVSGDAVGQPLDYVSGASMLIGKAFLETVDPMRENYFLSCEEIEWCLRGRASGMRIAVTPDARVLRHRGSSIGSALGIRQRPRLQVYLEIPVTRDWYAWRIPAAVRAAFQLILLRYGARGALRQVGFALQGWWAGLTGERGAPRAI